MEKQVLLRHGVTLPVRREPLDTVRPAGSSRSVQYETPQRKDWPQLAAHRRAVLQENGPAAELLRRAENMHMERTKRALTGCVRRPWLTTT